MKINIRKTLEFFDIAENSRRHATPIVGMIGEELNIIAFRNYMKSKYKGSSVEVVLQNNEFHPVTQGTQRGKRLDRWILQKDKNNNKTLYQCEIKNWSSTAIGGNSLDINAKEKEIKEAAIHQWKRQLKEFKKPYEKSTISKVLTEMKAPKEYEFLQGKQKPLLIYWMPILNPNTRNGMEPYFRIDVSKLKLPKIPKMNFKTLGIFSVSIYFRQLLKNGKENIEFESPVISKRKKILNRIIVE